MISVLTRMKRAVRAGADKGASAVEYGLMVAAIAALIVGTVFALGGFVKDAFDNTCKSLSTPTGQTCTPPAPPK
ncbi:MAG TPA: Flp family type IVb pilin [Kineosporiaceae bacterium]|jgi:pilus assembly protein Flp/PilA|nr:Flp family type IVb pilin [Kineosporiaceae bacterium]